MRSKRIVAISASPSRSSKTAMFVDYVLAELGDCVADSRHIKVRDIEPAALLSGNYKDEGLRSAVESVDNADAVIIATPIFKASYSGLLKSFLDLLPQFGLAGKSVLPLATGGTVAHVLSLDYALRPVLQSMGARHVIQGYFLSETDVLSHKKIFEINDVARERLAEVLYHFRCVLESPVADVLLGHPRPERASKTAALAVN